MSKERYEWYMGTSEIIDNKTKKFITQDCPELLNKQSKRISDLEAKLAEYKLYIESFKHSQDLDKKYISKLESDLAEKCRLLKTNETILSGIKIIKKETNQDKISFAVEKLTEIRDYVKNCWSLDTTEGKVRLDISKKIRLKIEALTHQHEDK